MNYEKGQDFLIALFEMILAIAKGIKRLRGIVMKKAKKMPPL